MTFEERTRRLENAAAVLRKNPIPLEELNAAVLSLQEAVAGEHRDDQTLKAKLYNCLGIVLNERYRLASAEREHLDAAIDALRAATACSVENPAELRFPFYNLARLLYDRHLLGGPQSNDDLDECIANYRFTIDKTLPDRRADLWCELGDLYMLRNKPGDAQRAFEQYARAKVSDGQKLGFYIMAEVKIALAATVRDGGDLAAAKNGEAQRLLEAGQNILAKGEKNPSVLETAVVMLNVALRIDFSNAELRQEITGALAEASGELSALIGDEEDALSMVDRETQLNFT